MNSYAGPWNGADVVAQSAAPMIDRMACEIASRGIPVAQGEFGADMQVELVNDGPVTILMDSKKTF